MTNKLFVFFLTLALVAGCGPVEENKSKKIPQNILNLDKMAELIADLQIAESVLNELQRNGEYDKSKAATLMSSIFETNSITQQTFDESRLFYENNPHLYEFVYEKVITLLTEKQTELTVKAKKDSVLRKMPLPQ